MHAQTPSSTKGNTLTQRLPFFLAFPSFFVSLTIPSGYPSSSPPSLLGVAQTEIKCIVQPKADHEQLQKRNKQARWLHGRSNEQWNNQEPRTKNKEPRAKSQEPKNQEPRTKKKKKKKSKSTGLKQSRPMARTEATRATRRLSNYRNGNSSSNNVTSHARAQALREESPIHMGMCGGGWWCC